jgi:hypothetical protein
MNFAIYKRFYCTLAAVLLAGLVLPSPQGLPEASAQQAAEGTKVTVTTPPAGKLSWDEMLEIEARAPSAPQGQRYIPRGEGPGPREIGIQPEQPIAPATSLPEITPPPDEREGRGPFGMTSTFIALEDANTSIPPDTMGAVGPNHLMTMLNTQVRIQNKSGTNISTVTLSTFWSSITGDPFDPKVIYDAATGRWLSTVDLDGNSTTSGIGFAISDTSDPTGNWTFYSYDADASNSTWADFPGFGVNDRWIAITNNMFTVAGSPLFSGIKMWVIDKSTALAGGALTTTIFAPGFDVTPGGYYGFTMKPCQDLDNSSPTVLYIVDNSGWASGGTFLMRLSRITGTAASPSWSVVPGSPVVATAGWFVVVNNFTWTLIQASQPGTGTTIDTGDGRMTDPVYRNDRIWAVHSGGLPAGGAPNRTAAFWYELDPAQLSTTPIIQSGVLDPGTGSHYSYPSIVANKNDDVAIGFSHANSSTYIREMATGRLSTDAAGTMNTPYEIRPGEDTYVKDYGSGLVRWGDYSATRVDPVDDTTFWSIQQRAVLDVGAGASDDRWETNWSQNKRNLDVFVGEDEALAAAFKAYLDRFDLGFLVAPAEESPE